MCTLIVTRWLLKLWVVTPHVTECEGCENFGSRERFPGHKMVKSDQDKAHGESEVFWHY